MQAKPVSLGSMLDVLEMLEGRKPLATSPQTNAERWRDHVVNRRRGLEGVPPSEITLSLLAMDVGDGSKVLHLAACKGQLKLIPEEVLASARTGRGETLPFTWPDPHGNTALHLAAAHGDLGDLPARLRTPALLGQTNRAGETVPIIAALSHNLHHLPAAQPLPFALLSQATLKTGDTVGHIAAATRQLVPWLKLCHERDRDALLAAANRDGQTVLHYSAHHGSLDQVPRENLTPDALAAMDVRGDSVLHVAIRAGNLDQVPPSGVTPELLAHPNLAGETSFEIMSPAARRRLAARIRDEIVEAPAVAV